MIERLDYYMTMLAMLMSNFIHGTSIKLHKYDGCLTVRILDARFQVCTDLQSRVKSLGHNIISLMTLCPVQYAVVGRGLDNNVVTSYWLDAARHLPERNDDVSRF